MLSETKTIFTSLDAPFVNFEKNIEPIIWQSKDILILQNYDFKIPTITGSIVKYSFATVGGDINFSTEFHVQGQVSFTILIITLKINYIYFVYLIESSSYCCTNASS